MSIESEKITAQKGAWGFYPPQPWHRHLIGPAELEFLFKSEHFLQELRRQINALEDKLINGVTLHYNNGYFSLRDGENKEYKTTRFLLDLLKD